MPASQLIYVTGKIFESVSHEETHLNAKYGTYIIREGTNPYESYAYVIRTDNVSILGVDSITIPSRLYSTSSPYSLWPSASITKQNGEWILGGDGSSYNTIAVCSCIERLSSRVFNTDSYTKTNWVPIQIISCSSNLTQNGVTSGNGVKGILDTDLFRCGISGGVGTKFDNEKYITLEANQNLLTGWDPSNKWPPEYMI